MSIITPEISRMFIKYNITNKELVRLTQSTSLNSLRSSSAYAKRIFTIYNTLLLADKLVQDSQKDIKLSITKDLKELSNKYIL